MNVSKGKTLVLVKYMNVDEDELWSNGSMLKIKWKPLGILGVEDLTKKKLMGKCFVEFSMN